VVEKETTTIIDGAGKATDIKARIESSASSRGSDQRLRKRSSRSVCEALRRVALIKVGAATEIEMKEKKARGGGSLHAPVRPSRKRGTGCGVR